MAIHIYSSKIKNENRTIADDKIDEALQNQKFQGRNKYKNDDKREKYNDFIFVQVIGGRIDNLQEKLEGKIPVTWPELVLLIDSWGRNEVTKIKNQSKENLYEDIHIEKQTAKECYDLSKLDVSNIKSFAGLFKNSNFNGDISNWNVSQVKDFSNMFENSKFNGDLSKWDVGQGKDFSEMFQRSKFNGNITNWDMRNAVDISKMFSNAVDFNQPLNWDLPKLRNSSEMFLSNMKLDSAIIFNNLNNLEKGTNTFFNVDKFENKFNESKSLPFKTKEMIEWFEDNKEQMIEKDPILKARIEEKNIKNNLIQDKSINSTNEVVKEAEDLLDKINKEIENSKVKLDELKAIKENLEKAKNDLNKIGIDR